MRVEILVNEKIRQTVQSCANMTATISMIVMLTALGLTLLIASSLLCPMDPAS